MMKMITMAVITLVNLHIYEKTILGHMSRTLVWKLEKISYLSISHLTLSMMLDSLSIHTAFSCLKNEWNWVNGKLSNLF